LMCISRHLLCNIIPVLHFSICCAGHSPKSNYEYSQPVLIKWGRESVCILILILIHNLYNLLYLDNKTISQALFFSKYRLDYNKLASIKKFKF
jgi:hypothetical protein